VRIIGGEWRGRRVHFPTAEDLRPTPDRVRETLFNWLQPVVSGARCLDLFAGSGVLGLEALSRGASAAVFVEHEAAVAAALGATLATLGARGGQVLRQDALRYLAGSPEPFGIVFLDPPFARGGLGELCTLLEARGWLAADAYVYVEQSAQLPAAELPGSWAEWREMRTREVWARLLRRVPAGATAVSEPA
jgi:16S rRNA (guanine966-N2)-methyltransferase